VSTLYNSGGTVTLTNSEVSYSKYRAVESDSGTFTMSSTTLSYNPYGFYHGGGTSNIGNRGNLIASSSSYGVYNNTGTSLNAENIYWPATTTATSTGPYHSTTHTSGNGARVSDNVDYTPWATDRHYLTSYDNSVDSGEIRWGWETAAMYETSLWASIATWNTLGSINIATDTDLTVQDLDLYAEDYGKTDWYGQFVPLLFLADNMAFNVYYLQYLTSTQVQSVITHEFGHALGLDHSYMGNIMYDYFSTVWQTVLGYQDLIDYDYLW
jgi:hypothetical protein